MSARPLALEDLVIRMRSRLRLASAAAEELQWGDLSGGDEDSASELIRASVIGALEDLQEVSKRLPFPISGYSGEPITEWLQKQATKNARTTSK